MYIFDYLNYSLGIGRMNGKKFKENEKQSVLILFIKQKERSKKG